MDAQPPNFDTPPRNKKNAISGEPVELETSFNDQTIQKWWFSIYVEYIFYRI